METKKVVIPQNLGKTIKWQNLENGKFDVNLSDDFVVNDDGSVSLADNAENHLTAGRLKPNTTIVELTMKSGTTIEFDIGDIIPNHVADIFLSNVALNGSNLQLTVANGNGEGQDKVLSVDVSDLIPVTTQGSIQGDGTENDPIKIKIKTSILLDTPDGLCIDKSKLVKLVDTTGKVELGYILPLNANYCGGDGTTVDNSLPPTNNDVEHTIGVYGCEPNCQGTPFVLDGRTYEEGDMDEEESFVVGSTGHFHFAT